MGGKGSSDAGLEVSMTSGSVVKTLDLTDPRICSFFEEEEGGMKHMFDAFDVDNPNDRVACPYVYSLHYECTDYNLRGVCRCV